MGYSFTRLLKDLKKQTSKYIRLYLMISLLIIVSNITCVSIAANTHYGVHLLICIILCVLVGIVAFVLAMILIYRFLLFDSLFIAYEYLNPFFKNLASAIAHKIEDKSIRISAKTNVSTVINIGLILSDSYRDKIPSVIKKSVVLLLSKIPLYQLLGNVTNGIKYNKKENRVLLDDLLYNRLEVYILNKQDTNKSLFYRMMFFLILLNMLIQILLIILIN